MKKFSALISTVLFFGIGFTVYSQSKTYFNEDWIECAKENAHFYRITDKKNDSLYHVKDFYINSILQMDGYFSDMEKEIFEGKVCYYDPQGKITNSETYANGKLNGLTTVYLKNGKIDYTTEYKNGTIYNGVYNGLTAKRFYKNGEVVKDVEQNPPNQYYILKTTIYGKKIDSVFWRTAKGKELGFGTYKDYEIIDGLNVLNMLDNTVYTHYKNGLREGIRKVYDGNGKLVANMTFKNDMLILDETLNPLTNKMVSCSYKDNNPQTGRWFVYKPMYEYYEEFVFENGVQIEHNRYDEDKNGKLIRTELN